MKVNRVNITEEKIEEGTTGISKSWNEEPLHRQVSMNSIPLLRVHLEIEYGIYRPIL